MSLDADFTIFAVGRNLCSIEQEAQTLLSSVSEHVKHEFVQEKFNELSDKISSLGVKSTLLLENDLPEEMNQEICSYRRSGCRIETILRHADNRLIEWKPPKPEVKQIDSDAVESVELLIANICNMPSLPHSYCTKQEVQVVLTKVEEAVTAINTKFGLLDIISDLLLGSIVKPKLSRSILSDLNKKKAPLTWTKIRKVLRQFISSAEEVESTRFRSNRPTCYACRRHHILLFCPTFHFMTVADRWKVVKQTNICANCFSARHSADACEKPFRCRTCGEAHNTFLHATNTCF